MRPRRSSSRAPTRPRVRADYRGPDRRRCKPRFDLYAQAHRANPHPWLVDLLVWSAQRSPRRLQRMAGVLEETYLPRDAMSLRGILRRVFDLPLRRDADGECDRDVPAARNECQHADRRDVQLHGLRDARRGAQGRLRHRLLRGQGRAPVRRYVQRPRVAGRRDGAPLSDQEREHRRPHPQGDPGPGGAGEHPSVRARAVGPLLGVRAQRRPEGLRAAPARRLPPGRRRPTASAPSAG